MTRILEGQFLAAAIREEVKRDVDALRAAHRPAPHLAVFLVGDDPASKVYVGQKEKACAEVGIRSSKVDLPGEIGEADLLAHVRRVNEDPDVSGVLVQLPLPAHISSRAVQEAIHPLKDVDAVHPENMGRLFGGAERFAPCTPAGIMRLLHHYRISVSGKRAVVIGRSLIVGKPLSMLLLAAQATVTMCHSKTTDLHLHTHSADIVVAAVGSPRFLKADMVGEGATVIDVGTSRVDGRLVGDADFEAMRNKVRAITPVPGGVGPLTVAMLMRNVLTAASLQNRR